MGLRQDPRSAASSAAHACERRNGTVRTIQQHSVELDVAISHGENGTVLASHVLCSKSCRQTHALPFHSVRGALAGVCSRWEGSASPEWDLWELLEYLQEINFQFNNDPGPAPTRHLPQACACTLRAHSTSHYISTPRCSRGEASTASMTFDGPHWKRPRPRLGSTRARHHPPALLSVRHDRTRHAAGWQRLY